MDEATLIWDLDEDPDGNVQHILEHDISKEEVEDVLFNPTNPTTESRTTGNPLTFGWTSTGRYLAVVWEQVLDNPLTIRPITAFEARPPRESRS